MFHPSRTYRWRRRPPTDPHVAFLPYPEDKSAPGLTETQVLDAVVPAASEPVMVDSGAVPLDHLDELPDDQIIAALVQVRGIGRWTAQMFLMFRLGRPNVLPELDLGIQKGIQRAYRLRSLPKPDRVRKIGAKWAPYSTVACWYLWRSLDTADGES